LRARAIVVTRMVVAKKNLPISAYLDTLEFRLGLWIYDDCSEEELSSKIS
jgi:hypothetical protein